MINIDDLRPSAVLTVSEVAELLRVSPETVRRLHRRGEIPALPLRRLLFTAESVRRFLRTEA